MISVHTKGFYINTENLHPDGDSSVSIQSTGLVYTYNGQLYTFPVWRREGQYLFIPPQEGWCHAEDGATSMHITHPADMSLLDDRTPMESSHTPNVPHSQCLVHSDVRLMAGEGDEFGHAIAMSNDGSTVLIGCPQRHIDTKKAGAVYVFTRDNNTWHYQAELLVSTDSGLTVGEGDRFGWSIALSADGHTALIGCMCRDTATINAGAAYVFIRRGTIWSYQTELLVSEGDLFGSSVALSSDGHTALIGCRSRDTGPSNAGAVYVFTRSGIIWSFQKELLISTGSGLIAREDDNFGCSIALSGDGNTALIGAYGRDKDGWIAPDAGAAYIFTRSNDVWHYEKELLISTDSGLKDAACNCFGHSVALSSDGNTALIGSLARGTGDAYVFTRSNGAWSYQAELLIPEDLDSSVEESVGFGYSVALSSDGSVALIGCSSGTVGSVNAGTAYTFTRSGTEWSYEKELLFPTGSDLVPAVGDCFGYSVTLSSNGDTALIGAYGKDTGAKDAGAVYVFTRGDATWDYEKELLISTDSDLSTEERSS